MYRKIFSNPVRYAIVYLFLPLVFFAASAFVNILYSALLEIAPNIIPEYNKVLEKEKYEAFLRVMNGISSLLSVFLISLITGVYDNARYEFVITKTDGLFKIPDEIAPYFKRNFPSDLIAVTLPGIPFVLLTLPEYSKKFLDYFGGYLAPHFALTEVFGTVGAYFAILSVALIARIIAMPMALRRYRSLWLTSFIDG